MARGYLAALMAAVAAADQSLCNPPDCIPTVPIDGVEGKVDFPVFGLGTWLYNDSKTEDAVTKAFGLGYRHVDTAVVYQNHVGVGKGLKASGIPRNKYFVTSKVPPGNASATASVLDQALKDMDLDYVDLMLIHFNDPKVSSPGLRKEQWLEMEKWARKGKARALGVSHYCKEHIKDIQSVATVPIAVNQVQYHVGMGSACATATDDKEFIQQQTGILYQSFSPLCGPCNPPDNKELLTGDLVTAIGKAHNKTGAQVALRWLVQQNIPVIPKSDSAVHLRENMDIFDFVLTDDEMNKLTAAKSPAVGGGPSPTDSGDCSMKADQFIV